MESDPKEPAGSQAESDDSGADAATPPATVGTAYDQAAARPKRVWNSTVFALVTIATIIGGIAAGFQIYDYLRKEPKPDHAKVTVDSGLPEGWRRNTLEAGASIGLPPDWEPLDRDAMGVAARTMGMDSSILTDTDRVKCLVYVAKRDDPATTTLRPFGMVVGGFGSGFSDPEKEAAILLRRPDCDTAKVVEMPQGKSVWCVVRRQYPQPDGAVVRAIQEMYVWSVGDRQWMLAFNSDELDYVDNANTFREIAKTLKLPED